MNIEDQKDVWLKKYAVVPETLDKLKQIKAVATAFNANIDAVIKISAKKLSDLIEKQKLHLSKLKNIDEAKLVNDDDVIKGIFKCFCKGIAEEWITEDKQIFEWMVNNIGYDRLQMGGQGGIVANVLAAAGVQKVFAHANSLPKLQAQQFLPLDNLLSFDEQGNEKPAYTIDRANDVPLIHWIIEFDKGSEVIVDGEKFVCPKSNRFIATYDPLNLHMVLDNNFVKKSIDKKIDYVILSGYHALTSNNDGVNLVQKTLPILENWKKREDLLHLEVASTQDVLVRKAIVDNIVINVDSIGINERETMDLLEVTDREQLAQDCEKNPHSVNLFKALTEIKKQVNTPRIQLHMFGLYITLQDKNFKITPQENLRGMMTAATVAAGKAGTGNVNNKDNMLWAHGQKVSEIGLKELNDLADFIGDDKLKSEGCCSYEDWDVIAVPTILIEKPITLVGMGDTISSMSLLAAR